jgi:hypothetical protein
MDTQLNKHIQQGLSKQKTQLNQNINSMQDDPANEFNANNGFLMILLQNMENWRLVMTYGINGKKDCPDFYNQLHTLLENMLDFLSAKISEEEEEALSKEIETYYNDIDGLFEKYEHQGIMMNETEARKVRHRMSRTFRKLLRTMQQKGILTKVSQKWQDSIGEFAD